MYSAFKSLIVEVGYFWKDVA